MAALREESIPKRTCEYLHQSVKNVTFRIKGPWIALKISSREMSKNAFTFLCLTSQHQFSQKLAECSIKCQTRQVKIVHILHTDNVRKLIPRTRKNELISLQVNPEELALFNTRGSIMTLSIIMFIYTTAIKKQ